ncbi:hypothetical protein QVD99_001220 [Batrachochytrium dendrobatidis]|nr:hypothetical protein QVD99_001220 [Batrachochytrium dendrobatidis]
MPSACVRCGSKKWRRNIDGLYVCEQGHQHTVQEQADDEDMDFSSQKRKIHKLKKRVVQVELGYRPAKRSSSILVEELQFELRVQVLHLVKSRNLPKQLIDVVRDLWLIWLIQCDPSISDRIIRRTWTAKTNHDDSSCTDDNTSNSRYTESKAESKAEYKNSFRHCVTLVFCRLGCRILSIPILLGDLIEWVCDGSMPFFSLPKILPVEIKRHFRFETKFVRARPGIIEMTHLQSVVIGAMNRQNIQLSDPFSPSVVLRLLKQLNLPAGVYLHYKAIRFLKEKLDTAVTLREIRAVASFFLAIKACLHSSTFNPSPLPENLYNELHSYHPPIQPELEASFLKSSWNSWVESTKLWLPVKSHAKGTPALLHSIRCDEYRFTIYFNGFILESLDIFNDYMHSGEDLFGDPMAQANEYKGDFVYPLYEPREPIPPHVSLRSVGNMRYYQHFELDTMGSWPLALEVYLDILSRLFYIRRIDLEYQVDILEKDFLSICGSASNPNQPLST